MIELEPPWSAEAEQAALGAMLIDAEARLLAIGRIDDGAFFDDKNRRVFRAFARLNSADSFIDAVALSDEMKATGDLEAAGGIPHVAHLVDAVPDAANIEYYLDVLIKYQERRRLVDVGLDLARRARPARDLSALTMDASERTRVIDGCQSRALPWATQGDLLSDPDMLLPPEAVVPRMAWRGMVTLFASREKLGKTTTAVAAVASVTNGGLWLGERTQPGTALLFSLEDPLHVRVQRLAAMRANHTRTLIVTHVEGVEHLAQICVRAAPDFVLVDTLPALVERLGLEPGNASAWTPIMRTLTRVTRDVGFAMELLHHANRTDGSYRDSTAIGANVDVILEMREDKSDPNVRRIKARGRVPVSDFAIRFHDRDQPYFSLADGKLGLEPRILAYIERNPGKSKTAIRENVEGRTEDIVACLGRLERAGAVQNNGSESRSAYYCCRSDQMPLGTGADRGGNGAGNGSSVSGAKVVPTGGSPPLGGAPGNRPLKPPERDFDFDSSLALAVDAFP